MRDVGEPRTCHYNITLESPLFCSPAVLDVYSTLEGRAQEEFAQATLEFKHNIITAAGLSAVREGLLEGTGCLKMGREFTDLAECQKEFHSLEESCVGRESEDGKCEERYTELNKKIQEMKSVLEENGLILPQS